MPDRAMETAPTLAGMQILVLEDDAENQRLLTYLLEDEGATVVCARNLVIAQRLLTQREFQLAVLDYALEGETAEPLFHELKARGIPFVIASGAVPDAPAQDATRIVLLKPYGIEDLFAAIQTSLQNLAVKE